MTNYGCLYAFSSKQSAGWGRGRTRDRLMVYAYSWGFDDSFTASTCRTVQR